MLPIDSINTSPRFLTAQTNLVLPASAALVDAGLQPDGKQVLAVAMMGPGQFSSSLQPVGIMLMRYNRDGSLDTTFGNGGAVVDNSLGIDEIQVQSDGKILALAMVARDPADKKVWQKNSLQTVLLRYNADGTPDTSFGTNGRLDTVAKSDKGMSFILQGDGRIVVLNPIDDPTRPLFQGNTFVLSRYNKDGSLDTTFGASGVAKSGLSSVIFKADAITVAADGKLLVAGMRDNSQTGTSGDFVVARYMPDGTLDASFGNGGSVSVAFRSTLSGSVGELYDAASSVAVQPDGKIVLAGTAGQEAALARLNANGSLDTSFGGDGRVTIALPGGKDTSAGDILFTAGGKILVSTGAYLVRYHADGTLDTSFGDAGFVAAGSAQILQHTDGKLFAADGKLLSSFGSDGTPHASDASGFVHFDPAYEIGAAPVVLEGKLSVHDAELAAHGYPGASIKLVRHDGANPDDLFSGAASLGSLAEGSAIKFDGKVIGTVLVNHGGVLELRFGANATEMSVSATLQQIAYSNRNASVAEEIRLDWTFSDGQGSDALEVHGATLVALKLPAPRDTVAPAAPVVSIPSLLPTGYVSANQVVAYPGVQKSAIYISGQTEANAAVEIYEAGKLIHTMKADPARGNWANYDVVLADGAHDLTFRARDAAGNLSAPTVVSLKVDTYVPDTPTVSAPRDTHGAIEDNKAYLSGTAQADAIVVITDLSSPTSGELGRTRADAKGLWHFETNTLSAGGHTLGVQALDNAGPSPQASIYVVSDPALAEPAIHGVGHSAPRGAQTATFVAENRIDLQGHAEGYASLKIKLGDKTTLVPVQADGSWHTSLAGLAEGTYTVNATAIGTEKSFDLEPFQFTVDTKATAMPSIAAVRDALGSPVKLTGTTEKSLSGMGLLAYDNGVRVGPEFPINPDGTWSIDLTGGAGSALYGHMIAFRISDTAGNLSALSSQVVNLESKAMQLIAPTLSGAAFQGNNYGSYTTGASATAIVYVSSDIRVELFADGASLGIIDAQSKGTDILPLLRSKLAVDGTYMVSARAIDGLGGVSKLSFSSLRIVVDTVAPQAPTTETSLVQDHHATLRGTSESFGVIELFDGTVSLGKAAVQAGGDWVFVTPNLSEGLHQLSIRAFDEAGNMSPTVAAAELRVGAAPAAAAATALAVANAAAPEAPAGDPPTIGYAEDGTGAGIPLVGLAMESIFGSIWQG